MSSTSLDLGHAVRSDGTLKDASEMEWTYDADESTPFPSSTVSGTSSGGPAPATMVAGIRRTMRVHRPSRRAREAAEAEAEVEASTSARSRVKRKVPSDADGHPIPVRRKVIDLDDNDDNDYADNADNDDNDTSHTTDHSEDGAVTELATEPADDDYEILKAMADADHQVCHTLLTLNMI